MSWHVGQEVVVIVSWKNILISAWRRVRAGKSWPMLLRPRHVYVVSAVKICDGEPCLTLKGHPRWSHRAWAFRPVVKFKNDISIFTAILDRVNKREVADA